MNMYYKKKLFARELRKESTPAEKIVWEHLRNRKFNNLKFRRQHVIHGFVIDFYCHELSLALEIDGDVHLKQKDYDLAQLNEAYDQILIDMGDRICEVVGIQNWHGYVTAIEGDKIFLSGGSRVGLKPGHKLEVFDGGRILEGIDGQRFISPGYKTAEIKIVEISDNQAEAVKVSGRGLKEGSIVRKK